MNQDFESTYIDLNLVSDTLPFELNKCINCPILVKIYNYDLTDIIITEDNITEEQKECNEKSCNDIISFIDSHREELGL